MTAQDVFGLDLQLGNGAGTEVFASVGSLVDGNLPEVTAETKDVTTHKSPNRYAQTKATLLKGGKVDFVLLVETDAQLDTLYTTINGLANHNWKAIEPNFVTSTGKHGEWAFNGPLTRVKPVAGGPSDVIKVEISIDISGKPTYAEVADA